MKKVFPVTLATLLFAIAALCTACGEKTCTHSWKDATCLYPQTCTICGISQGRPLGHDWEPATCTVPKTCVQCGRTSGQASGHDLDYFDFAAPTCTQSGHNAYEACTVCDYTTFEEIASYTAEQVYALAKDCAVEIHTYDQTGAGLALGSGFVYKANGQIITNYHVIEGATSAKVYVGDTPYNVTSVLAYDVDIDLALLKISASNLTALKTCSLPMRTGATVFALGSSRGLTSTFSRGIVATANRVMNGVSYVQHDAAISNGNSGGPLLNEYGEIIGVNTLTIKDAQNLNFAISVAEIDNLAFGNPMTLQEVYERECDVWQQAKAYVATYGSYSSSGYILIISNEVNDDGTQWSTGAIYDPTNDLLSIVITWGDYFLIVDMIEGAATYDYYLHDDLYDYYLDGKLQLNTLSDETYMLGYADTNISYSNSSLINSFRELGATLTRLLIKKMNLEIAPYGMTVAQFGFVNF